MNSVPKNRVVIIRSNPINPDSRVEKEALSLAESGFKVQILCWDRDSNHKEERSYLSIGGINIPITRLGYKSSYGEGLKNIIPYLKFQFAMRRWLKNKADTIDIVHACDFDTAFFSYKLVLRMKKKLVFDIFDFICGKPKNILQKYVKKSQLKIINHADATIICTEMRQKQIEGSNPKKLIVIHNSPSNKQLDHNINVFDRDGELPRVCYVGILQDGRLLREIGEYFSLNSDVEFHVGGFGYLESYFDDLSKKHDNIKYYGRLPYSKTLELEYNSDILLAIYDPSVENNVFAAPNKFYESLFLGKPIIMVKNTGMSEVVYNNKIGTLIDFSLKGFELGMNDLLSRKDEWKSMSIKAKKLYEEEYNWEIMKERLCSLYGFLSGEEQ